MEKDTQMSMYILLVVLLFSLNTHAQELLIHGPSVHFNEGHNNGTYGVGYQYKDFLGGVYYNSEWETSVYAGYRLGLVGELGLVLGVVTGYERCTVCPAALLSYRIPLNKTRQYVST